MVPLVRQTWLRKRKGKYVAARPIVDRENLTVRYEVVESAAGSPESAIEDWGFDPAGMSVRGATTCPYSGNPVTAKEAKEAGQAGRMGAQLMAVACVEPGRRGKRYVRPEVLPRQLDEEEVLGRIERLCVETEMTVPEEPIAVRRITGGTCVPYGLDAFGMLFSARQQLLLLTLCKQARAAHGRIVKQTGDTELAKAVAAYLGLLVGRVADRGSTLCRWDNSADKTANTYARQALPMLWDYSEANVFGGASGDARMQLGFILEVIDHAVAAAPDHPAEVIRGQAQRLPLEDESVDAVVTDPPYYDNISYADLSDFFYVWHTRALGHVFPAIFSTTVTPKRVEVVMAPYRHGGDKGAAARFYEDQMRIAFAEANRVLRPDGPMVVVYAHKTTLGWSTLVDSIRSAGFVVTEAWPLATEMPNKAAAIGLAMLASSIFLVARKRTAGGTGNYATDVRPEMARIIESRVADLMAAGISGADLVIACVGAGLRPFTRYDRVELPNGEELPSERFLEEVQREVLEAILAAVFSVDRSGVGRVDTPSRFYVLGRYQYGGAQVEFGEVNVLAKGVGVELSGAGSLSEGSAGLVDIEKSKVRLRDHTERGDAARLGLTANGAPPPLIDVLHRLLWLLENDRTQIPQFLDAAQADSGRLRLLANALKGRALAGPGGGDRTAEQKAVDRLLAQWKKLVEDRALPLFGA